MLECNAYTFYAKWQSQLINISHLLIIYLSRVHEISINDCKTLLKNRKKRSLDARIEYLKNILYDRSVSLREIDSNLFHLQNGKRLV